MTDKLKLFIKEKLTLEEQDQLLSYVDDGNIGWNKKLYLRCWPSWRS